MVSVVVWNKRIFSRGSTKLGGRFYNIIQVFPRWYRQHILIDGESTVELDFCGLHLNMCYHRAGLQPPDDPYRIYGDFRDEIARPIVKLAVLIMLNAQNEIKAETALYKKLKALPENIWPGSERFAAWIEPLKKMMNRIMRFHHPIARYFNSDIGIRLQNLDSEIMRHILNDCMAQRIPAIAIHDSVVIPRRHEPMVAEIMCHAYREVMKHDIRIERK